MQHVLFVAEMVARERYMVVVRILRKAWGSSEKDILEVDIVARGNRNSNSSSSSTM